MFKAWREKDVLNTIESSNSFIPILTNDLILDFNKSPKQALFTVKSNNINNVYHYKQKLRFSYIQCALTSVVNIISSLLFTEAQKDEHNEEIALNLSFWTSLSTALLLIQIILRDHAQMSFDNVQQKTVANKLSLLTNYKLLIELLCNMLHPNLYLKGFLFKYYSNQFKFTIYYQYNEILSAFQPFKLYHCFLAHSQLSTYLSQRAVRVSQIHGVQADYRFYIKCFMEEQPWKVIFVLVTTIILVCGYQLRICEAPIAQYSNFDLSRLDNSIWCIIVTMLTLGYGDYYPDTDPGRIVAGTACFSAIILKSLVVITLTKVLDLDQGESKALILMQRLRFKFALQKRAGLLIVQWFRILLTLKKCNDLYSLQDQEAEFICRLSRFKQFRVRQSTVFGNNTPQDQIERKVNIILQQGEKLRDRVDRMINDLNN